MNNRFLKANPGCTFKQVGNVHFYTQFGHVSAELHTRNPLAAKAYWFTPGIHAGDDDEYYSSVCSEGRCATEQEALDSLRKVLAKEVKRLQNDDDRRPSETRRLQILEAELAAL